MVLAKETEEHMVLLKKLEIDITDHNFKTSRHCEHMRSFPQDYSKQLEAFLQKISSESSRKPNDVPKI